MLTPCPLCLDPNCQRIPASQDRDAVLGRRFGTTLQLERSMTAADAALQQATAACEHRSGILAKALAADPEVQAAMRTLVARVAAFAAQPPTEPAPVKMAPPQVGLHVPFSRIRAALLAAHACSLRMTGATANRLQLLSEMDNLLTVFQQEIFEQRMSRPSHPNFHFWQHLLVHAREVYDTLRPNVSPKNWDQRVHILRRRLEGHLTVAIGSWPGENDVSTLLHCVVTRSLYLKGETVSWRREQAKHEVLHLSMRARRLAEKRLANGTSDSARMKDTLYWLDKALEALSKMHPDHVDSIWDTFAAKVNDYLDKTDRTTIPEDPRRIP